MNRLFSWSNLLLSAVLIYVGFTFIKKQPKRDVDISDLVVVSSDGSHLSASDLEGKVVFLNFWATWCGPCVVEMPSIAKLYDHFREEDVVFVLASSEDMTTISNFVERKNYQMPHYQLLDDGDIEIKSIPLTYILDKEQKVIAAAVGARNWNSKRYKKKIKKALKQ